jgi:hypothetical protein
VVNGRNTLTGTREFPSQYMEVLRTGTDDGAQVEIRFDMLNPRLRDGGACPCGGLWVSAGVSVRAATFGQV